MTVTAPATIRRLTIAAALAAVAALTIAGCASSDAAPAPASTSSGAEATPNDQDDAADSGESNEASGDESVPVMPGDFPEDFVLVPDGELLSATGGAGSWTLVKTIQLVDQASAAVEFNERSFGFSIEEFVDGDEPSWVISNEQYIVSISVTDGDPYTMSFQVDER